MQPELITVRTVCCPAFFENALNFFGQKKVNSPFFGQRSLARSAGRIATAACSEAVFPLLSFPSNLTTLKCSTILESIRMGVGPSKYAQSYLNKHEATLSNLIKEPEVRHRMLF